MKRTLKRRQLVFVITAVALSAAGTLGMGYRLHVRTPQLSDERTAGVLNPVNDRVNLKREATANPGLEPQSGASFDQSRNIIAGGGGSSMGSGNLQVDGTVGATLGAPSTATWTR